MSRKGVAKATPKCAFSRHVGFSLSGLVSFKQEGQILEVTWACKGLPPNPPVASSLNMIHRGGAQHQETSSTCKHATSENQLPCASQSVLKTQHQAHLL